MAAIPPHHQPIAIVLEFVNPQRAGRWPLRLRRQAWFDKAGGHWAGGSWMTGWSVRKGAAHLTQTTDRDQAHNIRLRSHWRLIANVWPEFASSFDRPRGTRP